jgi:hypothetical protein
MAANLTAIFTPILDTLILATLLITVASGLHYSYRSMRLFESYQKVEPGSAKKGS